MIGVGAVVNFGCRLNIAEGEDIERQLAAAGNERLLVINSCAVTAEAARQARQAIRRLKRARPQAEIVVTGCAAETERARFAAMPEVARIVGNTRKLSPASWGGAGPLALLPERHHTRAFVVVQNGCDHSCTFCIIPRGRGPARSIPVAEVVERVRRHVDAGVGEVVLTGVDLTSYGPDLDGYPTLGTLVQRILGDVPGLRRLRLSSIDSIEADPALIEAATGEARVMPHLHLSLQAGDDMILKRMKRRHSRADAVGFVERVKTARPEIAIGADIIAGFPTETEAMFEQSLSLIAACDIVYGHIFPYSEREGTPAARMPQVPVRLFRASASMRPRPPAASLRHG